MANKNIFNRPTEFVDLPSKGLLYPKEHVLSSGKVELMYPGAQAEDILTNINYLTKGTAIDKYLEHLLVTDVDLDDFITGDKDALMVASRILGMGAEYTFKKTINKEPEVITVNISEFKDREVDWSLFPAGQNEFSYTLPTGKVDVKFKLLNGHDIKAINQEEAFLKKTLNKEYSADTTLIFKFSLVEVNGSRDTKTIREFVDRQMLQRDTRELKVYIESVTPSIIWKATGVKSDKEKVEDLQVPYDLVNFFWGVL